jgi:hypothetical protein
VGNVSVSDPKAAGTVFSMALSAHLGRRNIEYGAISIHNALIYSLSFSNEEKFISHLFN